MSNEEEGGSRRVENNSQNGVIEVYRSRMHIDHDPIVRSPIIQIKIL